MYNVRSGVITGLVLTVRPCAKGDRFSLLDRDKFCSLFFLEDEETGQFNLILVSILPGYVQKSSSCHGGGFCRAGVCLAGSVGSAFR